MPDTDGSSIPLIYVLSNGRSGSTLLDLLLGQHPKIWTIGEAQILPWELRENRAPCGCGEPIAQCPFWQAVLPQVPLGPSSFPIEYFRERHTGGRVLRGRHLLDILRRKTGDKRMDAMRSYGQLNARYLRVVQTHAESLLGHPIAWTVDASKDPYRLFWLLESGNFDLRVIHLVKDPRAFVFSMVKTNPANLSRVTRFAGRWVVENLHFRYLCRDPRLQGKTLLMRYEDLARDPRHELERVGDWLHLDFSPVSPHHFRAVENHAVSGNPMRWRGGNIVLDEKWREGLPPAASRLVWCVTQFPARVLGYG